MQDSNVKYMENAILVDADFVDKVAFDLIVNFERMIGRRIPQADMGHWVDCVALDGGLREGEHETLVIMMHDKGRKRLENFVPADYEQELNGKAFKDKLGEFTFSALTVEELTTKEDFFVETLQLLCAQKEVKRLMVVPSDNLYNKVREALRRVDDDDKRITVFSMEPREGGNFRQEILGYSLMAALGIRADEIHE
jgi:hypothetical protein